MDFSDISSASEAEAVPQAVRDLRFAAPQPAGGASAAPSGGMRKKRASSFIKNKLGKVKLGQESRASIARTPATSRILLRQNVQSRVPRKNRARNAPPTALENAAQAAAIHAAAATNVVPATGAAISVAAPSLNGSSIAPLLDLYQLDLAERQEPMEIPPAPAAVLILPEAPKEASQNIASQPNVIPATLPTHQAAAQPTPAAPQHEVVIIGPPLAASTPIPTGNVARPVASSLAPQLPSGSRSSVYHNSNLRPIPGPFKKGHKFTKGAKPGPYPKGLSHKPQQVHVQVQRAPPQSLRDLVGPRFNPQDLYPGAYVQLLPWLQEMYRKSPKKIIGYLISMPGKNRFERDFASKSLLHDFTVNTFKAPTIGPVDAPSYWDKSRTLKDHIACDYDCYVSQSCPLINCGGTLYNIESLHILRIQWPDGAVSLALPPQVPQHAPKNMGQDVATYRHNAGH